MSERAERLFANAGDVDRIVIMNGGSPFLDSAFWYITEHSSGVYEDSMAIVSPDGSVDMVIGSLEEEAARSAKAEVHVFRTGQERTEAVKDLLKGSKKVGVNGNCALHSMCRWLEKNADIELVDVSKAIADTVAVKDAEEIRLTEQACRITSQVARRLPEMISEGVSEKEVAAAMRKMGLRNINLALQPFLEGDERHGKAEDAGVAAGKMGYGDEAIEVLLKEMEDHRGQFCVILAGYKDEMKKMISTNPGLASRIQFTLDFPDYSREELGEIASSFLAKKKYEIDPGALDKLLDVTEYYRVKPNFANARTVRNILDQVIMNQNLRTEDDPDNKIITIEDVEDYLTDEGIDLSKAEKPAHKTIGFI